MAINPEILKQCWFLAGPTASGKTGTAIELAKILDAEILSLDSMAIYREMNIGTAKPTDEEQAQVPHHLINLINPNEEFSIAEYLESAQIAIQKILARNKIPLFAGGTGLYLRSLLRGVFEGPPADWELRDQLEKMERESPGYLHTKLSECDPQIAKKLHPNDTRRIVRAIEVFQLTGTPLSVQQQQAELPAHLRCEKVFWLNSNRNWLYERINRRVDLMIQQGLVEEVEALLKRIPPPGRTAVQGIGYKEIIEHLQQNIPLPKAIETLKTHSRQFAKRQYTWFRNLGECKPISVDGTKAAKQLAHTILNQ